MRKYFNCNMQNGLRVFNFSFSPTIHITKPYTLTTLNYTGSLTLSTNLKMLVIPDVKRFTSVSVNFKKACRLTVDAACAVGGKALGCFHKSFNPCKTVRIKKTFIPFKTQLLIVLMNKRIMGFWGSQIDRYQLSNIYISIILYPPR